MVIRRPLNVIKLANSLKEVFCVHKYKKYKNAHHKEKNGAVCIIFKQNQTSI